MQQNSIRKKIIILVACSLVLIVPLVYFFAWRASDNDYATASQYLDYMTKTNKTITVELSAIKHPGLINQTTPLKLSVLSGNYSAMHDALETNIAIARDFSVGTVYNKYRAVLTEHKQSLVNLGKSIKLYTTVLEDCKKVTDSFITGYNEDDFKSLLATCRSDIDKGRNDSQHKSFNDQFFSKYLSETADYMTSIEKLVSTKTNSETDNAHKEMEAIYDRINNLGAIELNLSSTNVMTAYSDLSSALESQKKALLR